MAAKAQSTGTIALSCSSTKGVPNETLNLLCAGLQTELAAKYPNATFVQPGSSAAPGAVVVMLEAYVANKAGLEAQLSWQTKGSPVATGPRMGLSVSNKDITPDMQMQFLHRLVNDVSLPF